MSVVDVSCKWYSMCRACWGCQRDSEGLSINSVSFFFLPFLADLKWTYLKLLLRKLEAIWGFSVYRCKWCIFRLWRWSMLGFVSVDTHSRWSHHDSLAAVQRARLFKQATKKNSHKSMDLFTLLLWTKEISALVQYFNRGAHSYRVRCLGIRSIGIFTEHQGVLRLPVTPCRKLRNVDDMSDSRSLAANRPGRECR